MLSTVKHHGGGWQGLLYVAYSCLKAGVAYELTTVDTNAPDCHSNGNLQLSHPAEKSVFS